MFPKPKKAHHGKIPLYCRALVGRREWKIVFIYLIVQLLKLKYTFWINPYVVENGSNSSPITRQWVIFNSSTSEMLRAYESF